MRRACYPPWYGLPRGVELRPDGTAALPGETGGLLAVPWRMQLIALLLTMAAGLFLLGFYVFMAIPTGASAATRQCLLSSAAGAAYLESGFWPYSWVAGLVLATLGIYLAWTTRFLTGLEDVGPGTRLLAALYVAPGVLLLYGAAAAFLVLVVMLAIAGIAFIVAAIAAAANSD